MTYPSITPASILAIISSRLPTWAKIYPKIALLALSMPPRKVLKRVMAARAILASDKAGFGLTVISFNSFSMSPFYDKQVTVTWYYAGFGFDAASDSHLGGTFCSIKATISFLFLAFANSSGVCPSFDLICRFAPASISTFAVSMLFCQMASCKAVYPL